MSNLTKCHAQSISLSNTTKTHVPKTPIKNILTILNKKQVTKSREKTHLFNSFLLPLVNEIINIQCLQNIHFTKSDIKHHPNFRSKPKYFMSLGIPRLLELRGNNIWILKNDNNNLQGTITKFCFCRDAVNYLSLFHKTAD